MIFIGCERFKVDNYIVVSLDIYIPEWSLLVMNKILITGGIRFLAPFLIVWGYVDIYRRKKYVGGATGGPRGWRALPRGVGASPYLMASSKLPLRGLQVSRVAFLPKISFVKFQVNWTPFDFPFL